MGGFLVVNVGFAIDVGVRSGVLVYLLKEWLFVD